MPHAMMLTRHGGPEALEWQEVDIPKPGVGEVLIRHTAIGVNYPDIEQRKGLLPTPDLPYIPGMEGCGVVVRAGNGVPELEIGDRVAYATPLGGAYSEMRVVPVTNCVRVIKGFANEQAAGFLFKGLMAHVLLRRVFAAGTPHTILVHAAAGGVGLYVVQLAKHQGARVIGLAGTEEKRQQAKRAGCDHVVDSRDAAWPEAVKEYTRGLGVHAVFDGVGHATFDGSIECLRPMGTLVSFGQASGAVNPIQQLQLRKKSVRLANPSMFHYLPNISEFQFAALDLMNLIIERRIRIHVNQTYKLEDIAKAHADMEARKTMGSVVLLVGGKEMDAAQKGAKADAPIED